MKVLSIALYVAAVTISVVLVRIAFWLLKNGAQRISDGVVARRSALRRGEG